MPVTPRARRGNGDLRWTKILQRICDPAESISRKILEAIQRQGRVAVPVIERCPGQPGIAQVPDASGGQRQRTPVRRLRWSLPR
jgi:hypothetical protein